MNELAKELNMALIELRRKNILKQNTKTATSQLLTEKVILEDMMDNLLERRDYYRKRKEYEEFNQLNQDYKRGISLVTCFRGVGLGAEEIDERELSFRLMKMAAL